MTELAKYRNKKKLSQRDLAKQIGISQGVLSRFEAGLATPGLEMAFRIQRVTGGAVKAQSWVSADGDAA